MIRAASIAFLLQALLVTPASVLAQSDSDKLEVIQAAARSIREIQKVEGTLVAEAEVDMCYMRVMRPSHQYSRAVEECITKDYVVTNIKAAVYGQASPEIAKRRGIDPRALLARMGQRIAGVFLFFGVPHPQGVAFSKMLKEHALQTILDDASKPSAPSNPTVNKDAAQ